MILQCLRNWWRSTGSGIDKHRPQLGSLSRLTQGTVTCQCGQAMLIIEGVALNYKQPLNGSSVAVDGLCFTMDGQTLVHRFPTIRLYSEG